MHLSIINKTKAEEINTRLKSQFLKAVFDKVLFHAKHTGFDGIFFSAGFRNNKFSTEDNITSLSFEGKDLIQEIKKGNKKDIAFMVIEGHFYISETSKELCSALYFLLILYSMYKKPEDVQSSKVYQNLREGLLEYSFNYDTINRIANDLLNVNLKELNLSESIIDILKEISNRGRIAVLNGEISNYGYLTYQISPVSKPAF